MASKAVSRRRKGVRIHPPPPKGFDALATTSRNLARHGLPQRSDPRLQPEIAALRGERAHRYRDFEHLEPELPSADTQPQPAARLASERGVKVEVAVT